VLRTEFTEHLDHTGPVTSLPRAVGNALRFKKLSGTPWSEIVREGVVMHRTQELSWSQVIMAANTPMLLKASMVDGRPDLGVMSSGQVVGMIDDLPTVAELVERIMAEAAAARRHLCSP
jgi:NAD(P)H-dependent flavin oxidoreductase YrpB (nitropropane dioxygenase family)